MTVTDYALGQQATDRTRLLQAIGLSLKAPPVRQGLFGRSGTRHARRAGIHGLQPRDGPRQPCRGGGDPQGRTSGRDARRGYDIQLHGALFDPSFEASVLLRTDYRPPHEARRFRRTRARSLRPLPGRTIAPRRRDRSVRTGVARQTGARSQCPHSLRAIVNPAAESSTAPRCSRSPRVMSPIMKKKRHKAVGSRKDRAIRPHTNNPC